MRSIILLPAIAVLFLSSCSTVYYGAMEKVGVHKRDIMISRVKKARSSEQKAKKVFNSALDEFISVTDYKGGDLEKQYNKVNKAVKAILIVSILFFANQLSAQHDWTYVPANFANTGSLAAYVLLDGV